MPRRYIASGPTLSVRELVERLHGLDPEVPLPAGSIPARRLFLLPVLDWVLHVLTGRPRRMVRSLIRECAGREQRVSSRKLSEELGWEARPIEDTLRDTLRWMARVNVQGAPVLALRPAGPHL